MRIQLYNNKFFLYSFFLSQATQKVIQPDQKLLSRFQNCLGNRERTHQKEKEALPSDPYTEISFSSIFQLSLPVPDPLASPLAPAYTSVWIYDVASLSRQSEQQPHLQLAYWFDINTLSPLSLGASPH